MSSKDNSEERSTNESEEHWDPYPTNFYGPCPPSRKVGTKYGIVEGRRILFEGERQVDAFQGIPFAKPPVGELRFKRPEPPVPWQGVKETKKFGPRGIQKDSALGKWTYGPTSEDNLYLNVFTPVWEPQQKEGFAVLVYIHGGAFVSDSCVKYGDIGICKNLVTKDVVVVTLQYRLGFLGFFSTGDEHCPGNNALWDMTMGLQWIQDNIAYFNGDPRNVTIMGQSAGGASVDLLSISPASRDLFHKVIPMAGNASCKWSVCSEAVRNCRKKVDKVGVDSSLDSKKFVDDLRRLEAMDFAASMDEPLGDKGSGMESGLMIGPRHEHSFLPRPIDQLRKEAPGKPRMYGTCEEEGMLLAPPMKKYNLARALDIVASLIPEDEHPEHFKRDRLEILKLAGITEANHKEDLRKQIIELFGDTFLFVGTQKAVLDNIELDKAPVYFYSFNYCNPDSLGPFKKLMPFVAATHCSEIPYIFGVGLLTPFEFNKKDKEMLEITTRLWTNFAKYGNPNGCSSDPSSSLADLLGKEFHWSATTKHNPQRHLAIGDEIRMEEHYKNGRPLTILKMRKQEHAHI